MAYSKKIWKARQGLGLNKFSIDGATPVPITNQPDSVTQQGDALSAGNLNDLEDRIANAFDDVEESKADVSSVTEIRDDLQSQLDQHEARIANLEQVSGEYVQTDLQDYSSVPTGKATYALVETLKGVSRVENQLIKNASFDDTTDWNAYANEGTVTITASGNIGTAICTSAVKVPRFQATSIGLVNGHSYLLKAKVRTSVSCDSAYLALSSATYGAYNTYVLNPSANTWYTIMGLYQFNGTTGTFAPRVYFDGTYASSDTVNVTDVNITDLTQYFNGSIPSNAQTIAGIAQYHPELLTPRAYNAGEIVDSTYTKVESVGVNLCDGEFEAGTITTEGVPSDANQNSLRSKNYNRTYGASDIYVKPYNYSDFSEFFIYFYDANENFILYRNIIAQYGTASVPTNAVYWKARFYKGSTVTVPSDPQIMVNKGTTALAYSPYFTDQLSIPSVTLRSAGSVSDTLDVESGEITRRISSYTFTGNETWTTNGQSKTTQALADVIKSVGTTVVPNILCPVLIPTTGQNLYNGSVASGIGQNDLGVRVGLNDVALLTGVTIYFELATPTTESVTPTIDNTIKTEGGGTVFTDAEVDGQFTLGFLNL